MGWTPPESLLKWMDKAREDGKPIVYIGFGSITVPNPPAMTRSIIKAVIKSSSFRLIQYSSAHICIFLRRCAGDCLQGMVITNGESKRTGTRVPSGMLSGMLLITFSILMLIGYIPTRLTKSLMSKSECDRLEFAILTNRVLAGSSRKSMQPYIMAAPGRPVLV